MISREKNMSSLSPAGIMLHLGEVVSLLDFLYPELVMLHFRNRVSTGQIT